MAMSVTKKVRMSEEEALVLATLAGEAEQNESEYIRGLIEQQARRRRRRGAAEQLIGLSLADDGAPVRWHGRIWDDRGMKLALE